MKINEITDPRFRAGTDAAKQRDRQYRNIQSTSIPGSGPDMKDLIPAGSPSQRDSTTTAPSRGPDMKDLIPAGSPSQRDYRTMMANSRLQLRNLEVKNLIPAGSPSQESFRDTYGQSPIKSKTSEFITRLLTNLVSSQGKMPKIDKIDARPAPARARGEFIDTQAGGVRAQMKSLLDGMLNISKKIGSDYLLPPQYYALLDRATTLIKSMNDVNPAALESEVRNITQSARVIDNEVNESGQELRSLRSVLSSISRIQTDLFPYVQQRRWRPDATEEHFMQPLNPWLDWTTQQWKTDRMSEYFLDMQRSYTNQMRDMSVLLDALRTKYGRVD